MARTRSPNYPAVDLQTAVDLVSKLEKFAQRHPVPADSAIEKAWSFKPGGHGYQCIAALRQFGLIQEEGSASKRHIRLTDDAAKVVHNHPERAAILRAAALRPKVHAAIAAKYQGALPPDDTIRTYLLFDYQPPFNPASVGEFLSQLRKTIAYSGVDLSAGEAENVVIHPKPEYPAGRSPGGVVTPPAPKRPPLTTGMTQAIFPLEEGEALLQMPTHLSKESFEDFEQWVALILKKAKRSIVDTPPSPSDEIDELMR